MKTVHKFGLTGDADSDVELPSGARVLAFDRQNGRPTIWALVDTDEKGSKLRRFRQVPTGAELGDADWEQYVGSLDTRGGGSIVHLFEVPAPS